MLLGKLESVYTKHKAAGITYVCSGIPCQSSAAILHHRVVACFREMFEISQPLFFPLFSLSHQARRGENQLIPNLTTQFYQRRFFSYYHVLLTDMATSSISSLLMTPSPSRSYRWKVHSSFSSGLPFTSTDNPNTKSCTAKRH